MGGFFFGGIMRRFATHLVSTSRFTPKGCQQFRFWLSTPILVFQGLHNDFNGLDGKERLEHLERLFPKEA
jgi:hypothetical protein